MSGPTYRGFSNRKEAIAYARETGLPLPDLYFVGRFSAYHYETVDLPKEAER